MLLKEIIAILEKDFPIEIAENWDNVGLILGNIDAEINKVQISLDLTESVVEHAIMNNVDLIISHHPPIFKGINKINDTSILGRKILKLAKKEINVYTLHTNLDSAKDGLNQYIAEKLEGENIRLLDEVKTELYNLDLYIKEDDLEEIEKFLRDFSYKKIIVQENMENKGISCYKLELVEEKRLLLNTLNRLNSKYEVSYNLFSLENKKKTNIGIGRIFNVKKEYSLEEYIQFIKKSLNLDFVRLIKVDNRKIKKVAIVNGSGSSYWKKAKKEKVDLFITGDIKYHDALDIYEENLNTVDIGHYESEIFFDELLRKKLSEKVELIVYSEKKIFELR